MIDTAKRSLFSLLALTFVSSTATAEYLHPLFARNAAMGDTGAAHARAREAHAYNPALLADIEETTLTIPGLGVRANDPEDLVNEIDDIQDVTLVAYNNANTLPEYQYVAGLLRDNFVTLRNEQAAATFSIHFGIASPMGNMGVAVNSTGTAKLVAAPQITQADIDALGDIADGTINPTINPIYQDSSFLTSTASALMVATNETGITFAGGEILRWGVTPKVVRVTSWHQTADVSIDSANTFRFDNLDEGQYEEVDTEFNLDAGIAWSPSSESPLTLGLMGRNLLSNDYDTAVPGFELELEPQFIAGVAWQAGNVLLAADWELIKTEEALIPEDNQRFGLGAEVGIGIAQLRGGFRGNLQDGSDEDVFSLGIGLNGGPMSLDVAAQFADEENGVAVQLSFVL